MEIAKKEVIRSSYYLLDIQEIFEYGEITFGENTAFNFYEDIGLTVRDLETNYELHPECRHLETKTKKYRNVILGAYLIIYRICPNRIEVLRAFHGSRSPKILKSIRKITIYNGFRKNHSFSNSIISSCVLTPLSCKYHNCNSALAVSSMAPNFSL